MKRIATTGWIFSLFMLFGTSVSNAQTLKEVINNSEVPLFYLGVDFTLARAIERRTMVWQTAGRRQKEGEAAGPIAVVAPAPV